MLKNLFLFIFLGLMLMAFSADQGEHEFSYPKKKDAAFYMASGPFEKFSKEWRGEDYYYSCEDAQNGVLCSVLFYKLTNEEKEKFVLMPNLLMNGPKSSSVYPQIYFVNYSNLKKYESNVSKWGGLEDDFVFSHSDVKEINGTKINQKHMYAYTMFDQDLFVQVHLSKVSCTPEDSTAMRVILDGLRKKK